MGKMKDALIDTMESLERKFIMYEQMIPQAPLTDDEIRDLWKKHNSIFEFARAIERKHGIADDNYRR